MQFINIFKETYNPSHYNSNTFSSFDLPVKIYYDNTNKISNSGFRVDNVLHGSKRGKDIFDLSGTLFGSTAKGSDFVLLFSGRHNSPDCISVVSPKYRFIIDHMQKFAYESCIEKDWFWEQVSIKEDWLVSHMSKMFIADVLEKQACDLPDIYQCFPAHEFILGQLLPHFNRLMGVKVSSCPVT